MTCWSRCDRGGLPLAGGTADMSAERDLSRLAAPGWNEASAHVTSDVGAETY